MHTPRHAATGGKIVLSMGAAALLLAACTKPAPKVAEIVAPPAPVGHVYPVAIQMPDPVSPRIKFTQAQKAEYQQAFNVVGLKSALMVAALACSQQDSYDTFMHEFQPHVLAAQREMDTYFHKASGKFSGQKMEDTYITLLANNQSVDGINNGQTFCLNATAEYHAVLAIKTDAALDSFVTNQPPTSQLASNAPNAAP